MFLFFSCRPLSLTLPIVHQQISVMESPLHMLCSKCRLCCLPVCLGIWLNSSVVWYESMTMSNLLPLNTGQKWENTQPCHWLWPLKLAEGRKEYILFALAAAIEQNIHICVYNFPPSVCLCLRHNRHLMIYRQMVSMSYSVIVCCVCLSACLSVKLCLFEFRCDVVLCCLILCGIAWDLQQM